MGRAAAVSPPPDVHTVLETLWHAGHDAYLVGGCVRDELIGRTVSDWDVTTNARPERTHELFPTGRYENRFGTVTVPTGTRDVEVTTFRRDHRYGDHRRPDSVTFSDDLGEDLLRRDFTVNAIAWGRAAGAAEPEKLVDPTDGLADLRRSLLRAVGDPATRFDEDALRLLRAARLSAELHFEIEPRTRSAMTAAASLVRFVSHERAGAELRRMVAADPPSGAFTILAGTGVLGHALPELAAQQGVPQDKQPGHDLWDHGLATVDAAAAIDPPNQVLRLAALLHDIGKPGTYADGHFLGHDRAGAQLAGSLLGRLAYPRRDAERVARLIAEHMFSYERRWTDAAVRRFIRRVGTDLVDDLLALREADNLGSGLPADAGHLDELRRRVQHELAAHRPLTLHDLAVNGDDLVRDLGITPGPLVGELLERLLGSVVADPRRNRRERLMADARRYMEGRP
jgi:tRNA nucleotidyltransferase (CCA-adding enzyme)